MRVNPPAHLATKFPEMRVGARRVGPIALARLPPRDGAARLHVAITLGTTARVAGWSTTARRCSRAAAGLPPAIAIKQSDLRSTFESILTEQSN